MSALASGCGHADSTPGSSQSALDPGFASLNTGIQFDSQMSNSDSNLVQRDLVRLSQLQITSRPDSISSQYFRQSFSDGGNPDVMHFLTQRIHYFVPLGINFADRLTGSTSDSDTLSRRLATTSGGGMVMATNLGVGLWFEQLASGSGPKGFLISDTRVPITSTRIGIVELGAGYSNSSVTQLQRMATLVHEARHSDCTGGLSAQDIERIRDQNLPAEERVPANRSCGHLHVDCPQGHDLAGIPACDQHAWGAYSIEMVFAENVAYLCTNCTEEERQQARMTYFDSKLRVLVIKDMLLGRYGIPDMSSSGAASGAE